MNPLRKILHKLTGLRYPQEYLSLAKGSFQQSLHAYLLAEGQPNKDITSEHLFTGYSPLVITLYAAVSQPALPADIEIFFCLPPVPISGKKNAIARLSLRKIREQHAGDIKLFYYEGVRGSHRFLNSFQQFIFGLNNRLFNKKKGNVFLHHNLYKQVQVAYSIPRTISLVTVSHGDLYNMFPTDLHGPVNEKHYLISLRHEGKACEQVLTAGKILLTEVHADLYKTVYGLGKNHMQEMKAKENYPLSSAVSSCFNSPLPRSALFYRELELLDSFTHGIHRLMLFKVVYSQPLQDRTPTLAHVHNAYATWRYNQGLPGNYLLR